MKKVIVFFTLLFTIGSTLIFITNCTKEEMEESISDYETVVNLYEVLPIEDRNEALEEFTLLVAKAMEFREFRSFVKNEVMKKFDYDYDILYSLIADQRINTEKYGNLSVNELLVKGLDNKPYSNITEKLNYLDNLKDNIIFPQISVPMKCEEWDAENSIPDIVFVPADYDEETHPELKAFDPQGNATWVNVQNYPKIPVLCVREADRVDLEGKLKVDRYGFVTPEESRNTTVEEAYLIASSKLKSGIKDDFEPIIIIVDSEDEIPERQNIMKNQNQEEEISDKSESVSVENAVSRLKSSGEWKPPAKIESVEIYPYNSYSMKLDWSDVQGARYYKIFREVNWSGGHQYLATIYEQGQGKIEYEDKGLTSGTNYSYRIRAYKDASNYGTLTMPYRRYASWRKNNRYEVLQKVYVSAKCWSKVCGWPDGDIELAYQVVRFTNNGAKDELGKKLLPTKTRNEARNQWCEYNAEMFRWDITQRAFDYHISFWEDEPGDDKGKVLFDNTTGFEYAKKEDPGPITGSTSFKITVDVRDDVLGWLEINHEEETGWQYFYHRFPVGKGFFDICITQSD